MTTQFCSITSRIDILNAIGYRIKTFFAITRHLKSFIALLTFFLFYIHIKTRIDAFSLPFYTLIKVINFVVRVTFNAYYFVGISLVIFAVKYFLSDGSTFSFRLQIKPLIALQTLRKTLIHLALINALSRILITLALLKVVIVITNFTIIFFKIVNFFTVADIKRLTKSQGHLGSIV